MLSIGFVVALAIGLSVLVVWGVRTTSRRTLANVGRSAP